MTSQSKTILKEIRFFENKIIT